MPYTHTSSPLCDTQNRVSERNLRILIQRERTKDWVRLLPLGSPNHELSREFFNSLYPPRTVPCTYDLTGQNVSFLKKYPKSNFWDHDSIFFVRFSAPKIGEVLMTTFSKGPFTRFFQKMAPGGGHLPDFTRRGTNYLHTILFKTYPKSNFLDSSSMFFLDSAPPN